MTLLETSHVDLPSRSRRTGLRMAVHAGHLISSILGDDWGGRTLRRLCMTALGAEIAPTASIHGGSYISKPQNLHIGARGFVNRNCYFDLSGPVILGDDAGIGHGATFITTIHEEPVRGRVRGPDTSAPIVLGEFVWIGANSTIMPGVTIGPGAIIGAGSLVTKDVGADEIWAGVPARFVRMAGAETAAPLTLLPELPKLPDLPEMPEVPGLPDAVGQ